jgi:hypothetical protein
MGLRCESVIAAPSRRHKGFRESEAAPERLGCACAAFGGAQVSGNILGISSENFLFAARFLRFPQNKRCMMIFQEPAEGSSAHG